MNTSRKTSRDPIYSIAVHAYLETRTDWVLHEEVGEDITYTFRATGIPKQMRRFPVQEIGERFVAPLENAEQVKQFLVDYGPYRLGLFGGSSSDPQARHPKVAPVTQLGIQRQCDAWRAYLGTGSVRGNKQFPSPYASLSPFLEARFERQANRSMNSQLGLHNKTPHVAIICNDVEEAVRAFVFLNRLARIEWLPCIVCKRLFIKRTVKGDTCDGKCLSVKTSRKYRLLDKT